MIQPEDLGGAAPDQLEAWVLNVLEEGELPVDRLLTVLDRMVVTDDPSRAIGLAELLVDALVERQAKEDVLRVLDWRSRLGGDGQDVKDACLRAVQAAFTERGEKARVAGAGFDQALPARECLRRLSVLRGLSPGTLCHDKTWGFGVVKRLDDFYKKVTIDFETKRSHQMSYGYAAETLDLIGDDHLLARQHRAPEALAGLIEEDPAEVVRITLRSFGPMSAPDLKERLVPRLFPEAQWKAFWDAARRALKADPLVELPARRNDPIRLRDTEKVYDAAWFDELRAECDLERILSLTAELEREGDVSALDRDQVAVVEERLGFVLFGAGAGHPELVARSLMALDRLGMRESSTADIAGAVRRLLEPGTLALCLSALPARDVSPFVRHLAGRDLETAVERLIALLPTLSVSVLTSVIDCLIELGRSEACASALAGNLNPTDFSPAIVYWCHRHPELFQQWSPCANDELLALTIDALAREYCGDMLKARNQIQGLFEVKDWFEGVLSALSAEGRERILERIKNARGLDVSEQRSMLARVIRLFPSLTRVVVSGAAESADEGEMRPRGRMTSLRSHRERREQLRRLVEEDIPANSREIGVARSYGDLRENAEYKYAKEHQGILMRRKAELESDLAEVNATDFSGFSREAAGMGTTISFKRPDGRTETAVILGEWDRDEPLNIVSCKSRLAEAVEGHVVGDVVHLPGVLGDERCELIAIGGLSDAVKAWIEGVDSGA